MSRAVAPSPALSVPRLGFAAVALTLCAGAQWYIYQQQFWGPASAVLACAAVAAAILLGPPARDLPVDAAPPPGRAPAWWLRIGGTALALLGMAMLGRGAAVLFRHWMVRFGEG